MNDQPECTDYAVAGTKFGTASCELDGAGDYVTVLDWIATDGVRGYSLTIRHWLSTHYTPPTARVK